MRGFLMVQTFRGQSSADARPVPGIAVVRTARATGSREANGMLLSFTARRGREAWRGRLNGESCRRQRRTRGSPGRPAATIAEHGSRVEPMRSEEGPNLRRGPSVLSGTRGTSGTGTEVKAMCGLFGLMRASGAGHPEWASDAFVALGLLAEERGVVAAGGALFGRPTAINVVTPTIQGDITDGGCRVVKGRGRFTEVWRPDLLASLDAAPVVLGHTRWATQGLPDRLEIAGPLLVGSLAGTHNGVVEAAELRDRFALPPAAGGADSEVICQALAAGHWPEDVLSALHGRAALAWVDRTRPGRLRLARGALRPLCVAVGAEGTSTGPRTRPGSARWSRARGCASSPRSCSARAPTCPSKQTRCTAPGSSPRPGRATS